MSKLVTLRQIVKHHLPRHAPPEPPEELPQPTKAAFEAHKASIAKRIDSLVAKRDDAMARLKHYGPMLNTALRWKATPGEPDFVALKRDAVLYDIRGRLSWAKSDASEAKRDLKHLRGILWKMTEESFVAEMTKYNLDLSKQMKRFYETQCQRAKTMKANRKSVLASFDEAFGKESSRD